jgi:hypothetical protein
MARFGKLVDQQISRLVDHLWPVQGTKYPGQVMIAATALCTSVDRFKVWLYMGKANLEDLRDISSYAKRHAAHTLAIAAEIDARIVAIENKPRVAVGWEVVRERDGPGTVPRCGRAFHHRRRKKDPRHPGRPSKAPGLE